MTASTSPIPTAGPGDTPTTTTPGVHGGWVLAGGVRTHYAWAGTEGPAIVLLHGGGPGASGEAAWRFLLPALAQAGFRAFAPDQLSMGLTDARPHAWPVQGHQSLVDHIADFAEALCLDRFGVVGNSQGAYVAAKLALDHPEKVDRAFLIASGSISGAMGLTMPPRPGIEQLERFDYTEGSLRAFLESIVYDKATVTDELVAKRHAAVNRPGIRESRAAFDAYRKLQKTEPALWRRYSIRESLPQIGIPARFVWGNQDTFAPVSLAHELEKLLPEIPFDYLDECGHQCQTDQPQIVNELAVDFFTAALPGHPEKG